MGKDSPHKMGADLPRARLVRDRAIPPPCTVADTFSSRLRAASWWTRLNHAHRHDWTVERLAAACGFDPQGTAAMAEAQNSIEEIEAHEP